MEHIKYLNIRVTEEFTEAYYIYVCVYSLVFVYVGVCVCLRVCEFVYGYKKRKREGEREYVQYTCIDRQTVTQNIRTDRQTVISGDRLKNI